MSQVHLVRKRQLINEVIALLSQNPSQQLIKWTFFVKVLSVKWKQVFLQQKFHLKKSLISNIEWKRFGSSKTSPGSMHGRSAESWPLGSWLGLGSSNIEQQVIRGQHAGPGASGYRGWCIPTSHHLNKEVTYVPSKLSCKKLKIATDIYITFLDLALQ